MPDYHDTLGDEVAEVCALANFAPDAAQRDALDMIFAFNRTPKGPRVAARDAAAVGPRQNIKTGLLKQCTLGWLFVTEERLTVWSAHEFSTAQEAFRDMCELIESSPDLDAEVKQIHRGNGDEAIELKGDRRLRFKARTKGGGRGLTGNRVVLDEAMYLRPVHMGALVPTLRAVADPQLVYAGSAGMLESEVWRTIRDRGRAGGDPSLAYIEFADPDAWTGCADGCSHIYGAPDCAMDDESRWWRSNPALGVRVGIDALRADRRTLPPIEFARETLGWWEDPPPDDVRDKLFPLWPQRAGTPIPAPGARVALGVDTSWDRSASWIAAATELPDGRVRGEVVATGPGTGWVRGWLLERLDGLVPTGVAMQASGAPVSTLHEELSLHLPDAHRERLKGLTAADMARASGLMFDLIDRGGLVHVPHPALDGAAAEAIAKPMSDAWVIDRKKSGTDASPLVALSAAVAALVGSEPEYDPLANLG